MPLEMHSRLMGLWRTTERSAGPVVRMDGGTRKMKRIGAFKKKKTLYNSKFIKKKGNYTKSENSIYPKWSVPVACI